MSTPFSRAPHIEGSNHPSLPANAPNAALLIDFDNVTMGMRSDLSKELKTLLNSDMIKGKVTVQRAYADWRRYPQYIVPLSEASVDLIFAPAYGSSKKNATDIRMAIDGMELIFTRPEIGTYILLTGDSDFSSLVLKLKEYGKYVIGVGIQESSSDILVQNCDEYYSYTALSGLRKTSDGTGSPVEPWVLVEQAAKQMAKRGDVMRSDRLKQVMLELDPGFDEKSFGFSKFSRFVTEASSKGLLKLRKLENGQYEIEPAGGAGGGKSPAASSDRDDRSRRGRSDGRRSQGRAREREEVSATAEPAPPAGTASSAPQGGREALDPSYQLLRSALDDLLEDQDSNSVRDSDVKRRMLALQPGWDESELGFPKFSRFLRQAHDHEIINLQKGDEGNYHVSPGSGSVPAPSPAASGTSTRSEEPVSNQPESQARKSGVEIEVEGGDTRRLRPRLSSRRGEESGPPPLLEGQAVHLGGKGADDAKPTTSEADSRSPDPGRERSAAAFDGETIDPEALRLPTGRARVIKYLSNSYGGVGEKTAETLVDALGEELFRVLQSDPDRVRSLLPPARAEKLLAGWEADFERRKERHLGAASGSAASGASSASQPSVGSEASAASRPTRTRRTRGGGRSSR